MTDFSTLTKFPGCGHQPAGFGSAVKRIVLVLISTATFGACATGSEPQIKITTQETFSIETISGTSRQTIGNVTVKDLGEPRSIIQAVRVQACEGSLLRYGRKETKTKEGKRFIKKYPVFENVDPFDGIYLRKLRIRNDTGHVLRLNRIDAVLLDAAGNDNELMTKSALHHDLRARRPCSSTEGLIGSLRSLKLLGSDVRIRPGRVAVLFAAFSGVDKRIVGDWTLELNEVPVVTAPSGRVLRAVSFEFPCLLRAIGRPSHYARRDSSHHGGRSIVRRKR